MIEVKDLSFSYERGHKVLNNISLFVKKGENLGIIGPNGAGKTTFFYLLCGILKPENGEIRINDQVLENAKFHPETGFVFQNPDDQLFNISVYQDIAFGPANMGLNKDEVHKRAVEAMEITGIQHLAERPPHHLSGGEKRMAAIASIIAMNPQLMIYDEPTSNLDMRGRRRVIDFIKKSNHTNLIASHDLEFILETCERIIIIDNGEIVSDGTASSLMYDEELMLRHGLERPHSLLHKNMEHIHD